MQEKSKKEDNGYWINKANIFFSDVTHPFISLEAPQIKRTEE